MEIGPYIKLHRIQQEVTQAELAEGIVSSAYLSKIENQKTEASSNVIGLLCTRLGIQLNNETDENIREKCKQWYAQLFDVNDKQGIIDGYNELNELMYDSQSDSLMMFEIHKVRYFLVIGDLEQSLKQINKLTELSSSFDSLHQFYWYKFKGNYCTIVGEFNQAIKMYNLAEEKLNQLDLAEGEIADLQYVIAVTHSKIRNTLEAIDYAEQAMDIFQREYNFIRCGQCHIVLGISYRRIRLYDKSIKNYNLAKHLGELSKDQQIIELTNQNLGYLHSTRGDRKEAIYYYSEVLKNVDVELYARLTSVTSLIKEYYSIYDFDKAREMIDKGYELLNDLDNDEAYKIHYYVINTYNHAIKKDDKGFETLVIDEFIPYLQKHKDYANLVDYTKMLGGHFENLKKYKESVKYYKLATTAFEELINI